MKKLTFLLGLCIVVAGVGRIVFADCTKRCKDTSMLCTLYADRSVQDYFSPKLSEIMWSNLNTSATPDNVFPGETQKYTVLVGFTCPCSNAPLGEFQDGDPIYQQPYGAWRIISYPQYCNYCLGGY